MNLKVKIFAHRDSLVIYPINPEEGIEQGWWPTGRTRMGCVLTNTKERLGVSQEALDLMHEMLRNQDSIGDLSWFDSVEGYAISWWGPIYRIVDIATAEASREFVPQPEQCVVISNNVPEEILNQVNAAIDKEAYHYLEPSCIDY